MFFTDDTVLPIHSAIYLKRRALILDGNGVQSVKLARRHWKQIGGATRSRTIDVNGLSFFSDPDPDSIEFVMTHFNKISGFVAKYRLDLKVGSSHSLG